MNRSHVRAWCLYDFANSGFIAIFVTLFSGYYTARVVGNEHGAGDVWWGWAMSLSAAAVAVSAPFLGAVADRAGCRKRFLAGFTGLAVITILGFTSVGPGMIVRGFVLAALANFAYESAVVFYNAYLPDLAPPAQQGRLSGWGYAVGYVGSILAIGLGIVFVQVGRIEWAWIEAAAQFALVSIPVLLVLPADRPQSVRMLEAGLEGFRDTWRMLRDAWDTVPLRRFLGAYFLYVNGVNTVIVFAAVFAIGTLAFTESESLVLFLVVQASALAGALLMARPTDTRGPKFVVTASLVLWVAVVAAAAVVQTKTQFFCVAAAAGLGLGSVQAASRCLMAALVPAGKEAEFFGFYALCGKSSSILGPALFGMMSQAFSQRVAIVSVAVFFVGGLVLVRRVRPPERVRGGFPVLAAEEDDDKSRI